MLSSAILVAAGGGMPRGDEDLLCASPGADCPGLISLFDRPLATHAAEDLIAWGVQRIVVLADPGASKLIARALGGLSPPGGWLSVVELEPAETLASALERAGEMIGGGPFLLRWADAIGRTGAAAPALGDRDAVVLTSRWLGSAGLGGAFEGCPRARFHVGVYALARPLPCPARCDPGWLEGALAAMEDASGSVERRMVEDWWRYRGQPAPELDVNHFALERLPGGPVEAEVTDSDLVGAIRCDPSAIIRSSVIRGPVVIGAGAVIDHAFVGPFSSIGAGARIEGAEIENSVVRERSVVADLGTRLESSVIGPEATVARDFRLPRGARLSVGRGAQVSL